MATPQVVVIQKDLSPFRSLLREFLETERLTHAHRLDGGPLPAWRDTDRPLVIWDAAGFSDPEMTGLRRALPLENVGLLFLCQSLDGPCLQAVSLPMLNHLLVAPRRVGEVAAAFHIALANHQRICRELDEVAALRRRLAERGVVEGAKRVLMAGLGLGEAQAMRRMQQHSRNTNQKLIQVARFIMAAECVFQNFSSGGGPSQAPPAKDGALFEKTAGH